MTTLADLHINEKKRGVLEAMGIHSIVDLLTHYPTRYEVIIASAFDTWNSKDRVTFSGALYSQMKTTRFGKRSITRFQVEFDGQLLDVSVFFPAYMLRQYKQYESLTIHGVYDGKQRVTALQINKLPLEEQLGIHPVYPCKDGLTQKDLQRYIEKGLHGMKGKIVNVIPLSYRQKYQMIDKEDAMQGIHFPMDKEHLLKSLHHLKYEEFLKFHLIMQMMKQQAAAFCAGMRKEFDRRQIEDFIQMLPFALTPSQKETCDEILNDLASDRVMYRLLQGDVGCGKTLVAAIAMYACVLSGKQAVLMAPTEILARQHMQTLQSMFPALCITLLCASLKKEEKNLALQNIASRQSRMIVGTHALFQESVQYADIGLVIADEQHRFGVEQRRQLKEKGEQVDFLLMSATPIPRTLALSLYGDMSVSTISERPKGRSPIETRLVKENSMKSILPDILSYMDEGNQCYVICPMIEESEVMDLKHVQGIYTTLCKVLGKQYPVGLLHGKMRPEEKEAVMKDFAEHRIKVLVSTTVVEVGVNVLQANIMVIYDANRFGLSQLHQLRGRVGRGSHKGYCYLLCEDLEADAMKRMKILCEQNDGFAIAKEDLRLRGPGDILGKRQSGATTFVLGDIILDAQILEDARKDASEILRDFTAEAFQNIRKWVTMKQQANITYID